MEDKAHEIDKVQLAKEVGLVEKILALAEKPETLDEAASFSLELMKTQRTNVFDAVDVNEYVLYRSDVQDAHKAKDMRGIESAAINVGIALAEVHYDLRRAKAILEDV